MKISKRNFYILKCSEVELLNIKQGLHQYLKSINFDNEEARNNIIFLIEKMEEVLK